MNKNSSLPAFDASAEHRDAMLALSQGRICGSRIHGSIRFLGIPYGKPTYGTLRFQPPVPAPAWFGILDCRGYGAACPQINDDLPAWQYDGAHTASCLNLNVWMPVSAAYGDRLPVMVWLHGGAYLSGSANLPLYDGSVLAEEQQVVVVSINHRLNAFGYLYLCDLDDRYANAANVGQQDIVLALKWIATNIGAFGGDAANVTLFGESGGGGKICALTMMPSADGLYHKAIVQSGAFFTTLSREQANVRTGAFLSMLGTSTRALETIPDEQLLAAVRRLFDKYGYTAFWPVDDGNVLDSSRVQTAAVPMVIGTTRHEAAYFLKPRLLTYGRLKSAEYRYALANAVRPFSIDTDEERAVVAVAWRTRSIPPRAIGRDLTDVVFWMPAVALAERNSRHANTFMYRFDWEFPCLSGRYAIHGAEIPFVFGTLNYPLPAWDSTDLPDARYQDDERGDRFHLAARMRRAWADFACSGDPSLHGAFQWPRYTPDTRSTRIFDRHCRIESDPDAERRQSLFSEHAAA
ncbi:carboxylesterase/lipase family protein [Burkholderia stagnalis]|uniref:carboxylesterase/lipase family protein n=1 Tax=Burkholderia stagnalis TaxID=1503054 RepID=UPI000F564C90|nr:carboxylesterase family protein [Burkholderia stagnalis]RQQ21738.1 carboxylesterase/lipase family protein [Burkholderia stagnalis]RQQ23581.1 carboxylesterase/lipase family protein [Burkholderia stagnalis]RQQ41744.1 carboxylesterase/lipase family protein [Burkholderia stagnalis]RQX85483.1 carboxylesterase/lipase family protein [Burkholderia stagnalis]RQY04856.1 carboxylesterase/lipase family protein [Burkholderia stagnalis]